MAGKRDYLVISKDRSGEYRWTIKAGNGETIATGEGHTSRRDAMRAGTRVRPDVVRILDRTHDKL